jgi:hypothetical protein
MNIDQLVRDADPAALITIPDPPHVGEVTAMGRASQRRARRHLGAGITAGTAAAAVVLGLGLTGAFGSAAGTGGIRTTAPARGTGTIRTTAFTLVKHASGALTLTINLFAVLDTSTLQSDLQHEGIPAIVTTGRFCSSAPARASLAQVVSAAGPKGSRTMTINPAAMPPGTELSFGYFQLAPAAGTPAGEGTALALIDTNSYNCATTAVTATTPPPGAVAWVVNIPRPGGADRATGSARWTPAPTTTSPSR